MQQLNRRIVPALALALVIGSQGCWCAGQGDPALGSREKAAAPSVASGAPPPVLSADVARSEADPQSREYVFKALESSRDPASDRMLADLVRSEDDEAVRIRAIEAIEETGGRDGIAVLAGVLRSDGESPGVKQAAFDALEVISSPDAADALAGALEHPDPWVRIEAANALEFMEHPSVVDDLWRAYRVEDDPQVRDELLDVLGDMGEDVESRRDG